jgi:hypothetical protein
MKNIIKDKIIAIFAILAIMTLAFTPLIAIAADMWAETPDLHSDSEKASVLTEPATFKYENQVVDMWAETPDLNADQEDHGVSVSGRGRLVNNFNPEMYAETPDLNKGFTNRHMEAFEEITIADN